MNLTKNFASCRQSWQDSRQDRAKIFATVNLLLGKNLSEIRGRIPARFWPLGISFPGENLAGIPARFPQGRKIPMVKISPGSQQDSRQDCGGILPRSRSLLYKGYGSLSIVSPLLQEPDLFQASGTGDRLYPGRQVAFPF